MAGLGALSAVALLAVRVIGARASAPVEGAPVAGLYAQRGGSRIAQRVWKAAATVKRILSD